MPMSESITLPVDVANNGTVVNQVIELFDAVTGRKEYHFPAHDFQTRDTAVFTRSLPKPNGNFAGTRKASFKLTKDATVAGVDPTTQVKAPGILEINSSLPVGLTAANALLLRQRAIAILDSVFISDVQEKCEI